MKNIRVGKQTFVMTEKDEKKNGRKLYRYLRC